MTYEQRLHAALRLTENRRAEAASALARAVAGVGTEADYRAALRRSEEAEKALHAVR